MATKKSSTKDAPETAKPSGFWGKYEALKEQIIKRDKLRCCNVHVQLEALERTLADLYAEWAKGE